MPGGADTEIHGFRQLLVASLRQHAVAQGGVGQIALFGASSLPVSEVMGQATVTPFRTILECTVRKKATAITGKGGQFCSVTGTATGA